ncbi:hypothetical protein [Streptomyces sp. NPDC053726]|uniref:hypothetical protein n=1 Tax=Streptomyces sp. NPDC053726 TaxID=3365713 RepID=UPI0037D98593
MIRCEISAHAPDLTARWVLYAHKAETPRTALRWLRQQSAILADRLDPDPETQSVPVGVWREVHERVDQGGPDSAAQLRCWADDIAVYEQAMDTLADGQAVSLHTRDDTAYYTLTAVPQPFAVAPWAPTPAAPTPRQPARAHPPR